jgi:hypothetical protein
MRRGDGDEEEGGGWRGVRTQHTCHLRQPGLKLGSPSRASASVEKTKSVGRSLVVRCWALSGRSLAS